MGEAGLRAPRSRAGEATRQRIVSAAIETLKEQGFAGASARAIAQRGGFNQALIFYHFGGVNGALLAALDRTSAERMERYRSAVDGVRSLPELVAVAAEIYREDLDSGHIKVLAELIAGCSSVPGLGPQVVARVEPWVAFAEEAVRRVVVGSVVEQLIPVPDLAYGIVALYLGVELLAHLDAGKAQAEGLLATAARLAELLGGLLRVTSEGSV
jgi:AcrR family transcriptional regulator